MHGIKRTHFSHSSIYQHWAVWLDDCDISCKYYRQYDWLPTTWNLNPLSVSSYFSSLQGKNKNNNSNQVNKKTSWESTLTNLLQIKTISNQVLWWFQQIEQSEWRNFIQNNPFYDMIHEDLRAMIFFSLVRVVCLSMYWL